jgi:uncharacterized protein (TIGR02145 family)
MNNRIRGLIFILFCLVLLSCSKKPALPAVSTTDVTDISQTSAKSGGNVTDEGGSPVTSRGICWSLSEKPTIVDKKTTETGTSGTFSSNIIDLKINTLYYVRAYAANNDGTSYGNQVSFTTSPIQVPALTTRELQRVTSYRGYSGGEITDDFEGDVTSRGVCWGKSHNPTISDYRTSDGTGTGTFGSFVDFLAPASTYYLRAYATNSAGTGYGNEIPITNPDYPIIFNPDITYGTLTDLNNNSYKTVTIGTQVWMAENLKTSKLNDGTVIPFITDNAAWLELTTPGYCWLHNDEAFKPTIGALYNFYAVNTGKLCPTGWHVPSRTELTTLEYFLGGVALAAGKMKETGTSHWKDPNVAATNESGFTALPSPDRESGIGSFIGTDGTYCCWWLSSVMSDKDADIFAVNNENGRLQNFTSESYKIGFPVRCLKN